MTREDIICMAREADIPFNKWGLVGCDACESDIDEELERFAALVAAVEREACVHLVWTTPDSDDDYVTPRQVIADAIRARGADGS